jgi:hypothetical protein
MSQYNLWILSLFYGGQHPQSLPHTSGPAPNSHDSCIPKLDHMNQKFVTPLPSVFLFIFAEKYVIFLS